MLWRAVISNKAVAETEPLTLFWIEAVQRLFRNSNLHLIGVASHCGVDNKE